MLLIKRQSDIGITTVFQKFMKKSIYSFCAITAIILINSCSIGEHIKSRNLRMTNFIQYFGKDDYWIQTKSVGDLVLTADYQPPLRIIAKKLSNGDPIDMLPEQEQSTVFIITISDRDNKNGNPIELVEPILLGDLETSLSEYLSLEIATLGSFRPSNTHVIRNFGLSSGKQIICVFDNTIRLNLQTGIKLKIREIFSEEPIEFFWEGIPESATKSYPRQIRKYLEDE